MSNQPKKRRYPDTNMDVTLIKWLLFAGLFFIFFGFYAISNPQIMRLNRTAAITMTTFAVLSLCMSRIYGGFAIGKKRPRVIVIAMMISALFTDLVTYFELEIMNVNRWNHSHLSFEQFDVLFIVLIFQLILIFLLTYLAHNLYFKHHPPVNTLLIMGDLSRKEEYLRKFRHYRKEYLVSDIIGVTEENWHEKVRAAEAVFLVDIGPASKSDIIEYAYKHHKDVYMTTELADVVINCSKHMTLDDISVLSSSLRELPIEQRALKRAFDLVISTIMLILSSPIMLAAAIAIKIGDKGPVFYKQERLTKDGEIFKVIKFRTMRVDAEKNGVAQLAKKDDDRITPIGNILRKTRMDELPQIFNVFKGDMSLVGPRPERPSIAAEYYKDIPQFKFRLRAKAGLTGLAQIMGKYNTTPRDKLMLDMMYIERYSIWEDIMLLFQTAMVFFKSDSTEGFDEEDHTAFSSEDAEDVSEDTKEKE